MTNASKSLPGSGEIRIIGPQASGKSTFIRALVRWPNARTDGPIQAIERLNPETDNLIDEIKETLENRLPVAGTLLLDSPDNLPFYSLRIIMRAKPRQQPINLDISCREYAGELIEDLRLGKNPQRLRLYLDECANTSGLLILIDGTATQDELYAEAFSKLQNQLQNHLKIHSRRKLADYRVAVVFSKAEQSQVRVYLNNLQKFKALKFNKTQQAFVQWSREWGNSVNYFFCSAFGLKGNISNDQFSSRSRDGTSGVIDEPKFWQPFGLVAPIYWLHTGKDDPQLRNI